MYSSLINASMSKNVSREVYYVKSIRDKAKIWY